MPKVTVDGTKIEVSAGAAVLQACELAGVEIPRFCKLGGKLMHRVAVALQELAMVR